MTGHNDICQNQACYRAWFHERIYAVRVVRLGLGAQHTPCPDEQIVGIDQGLYAIEHRLLAMPHVERTKTLAWRRMGFTFGSRKLAQFNREAKQFNA